MKPILFNTEMVRAILAGRKTVTRRVMKPQDKILADPSFGYTAFTPKGYISVRGGWIDGDGEKRYGENFIRRPYCPGDVLYVREAWALHPCNDRLPPSIPCKKTETGRDCYIYRADDISGKTPCGVYTLPHLWRPSIHMPREAARIFLRVTDVRVERLQDIDDVQACAEGAEGDACDCDGSENFCSRCCNTGWLISPRSKFVSIWDSTIKPADRERYGWAANPWVWVIEFERITKEEAEHG